MQELKASIVLVADVEEKLEALCSSLFRLEEDVGDCHSVITCVLFDFLRSFAVLSRSQPRIRFGLRHSNPPEREGAAAHPRSAQEYCQH